MLSSHHLKGIACQLITMKSMVIATLFALFFFPANVLAQLRPTLVDKGEVKEMRPKPILDRTNLGSTKSSRPINSMLIVLTQPKDAEIFIDGKLIGRANEGRFKKELSSRKKYKIKVSAGQDYETIERVITLKPRGFEIVDAPLTSKYGTIKIYPARDGVTILMDNKPVPIDEITVDRESNIITFNNLLPGTHEVTYDLPGYVIYKRKFNISPGSVHSWNFIPALAVVELTVKTDPDTEVYVDEEPVGRTTNDGVLKRSDIKIGKHEIKLVKDDYEEFKKAIQFEFDKSVRISQELVPLPTSAEFSDDFDVRNNKWAVPPGPGVSINSGRLHLDSATSLVYPVDVRYRDFEMEFHLKLSNAGGAAWALRVKDPNSYYLFYLSGPEGRFPNRFNTYIVHDNKIDLASPVSSLAVIAPLKAGGQYQIHISAKGNRIDHTIVPADTGVPENFGFFEDAKNTYKYGSIGFRTVGTEKFSVDELFVHPR